MANSHSTAKKNYYDYPLGRSKRILSEANKTFRADVLNIVKYGSGSTCLKVQRLVLAELINQAEFADYSGALANAYQVGWFENGKFTGNFKSSYDLKGTGKKEDFIINPVPITYKKESSRSGRVWERETGKFTKVKARHPRKNTQGPKVITVNTNVPRGGWGHKLSMMKSIRARHKYGDSIVMINAAPYAGHVQRKFNRVMPVNADFFGNYFLNMLKSEIGHEAVKGIRRDVKYGKTHRKDIKKRFGIFYGSKW